MAKKKPDKLDEILDQLTENATAAEIIKDGRLLKELQKRFIERALEAEMTDHLGYEKDSPDGRNTGNSRNGQSRKTVTGADGEFEIDTPRDRNGSFEPQIVRKRQVRLEGFDEKVLSLYARGMTNREIQGHLLEIYGTEVSPSLITRVTDAVLDEVTAWQNRDLAAVYPIVYLDAIHLKIRTDGRVQSRAVYLAQDSDRRSRFTREAQAVAKLKHPNIITIHSVEEADGVHFLTMEFVEGDTLAAMIPRDGLDTERFFNYTTALADAVSAAHDEGITHRDLKPANIMFDKGGRLKVLDFGLAKLMEENIATADDPCPFQVFHPGESHDMKALLPARD